MPGLILDGKNFIQVTGTGTEDDPYVLSIAISESPALPAGANNVGSVDVDSIAMPTTLRNGSVNVTTSGTRVQLSGSSVALSSGVIIKAKASNTGDIYVGNATVASSNGFILDAGEEVVVVVDDLSKIYIDSSVSGEGVTYVGS